MAPGAAPCPPGLAPLRAQALHVVSLCGGREQVQAPTSSVLRAGQRRLYPWEERSQRRADRETSEGSQILLRP